MVNVLLVIFDLFEYKNFMFYHPDYFTQLRNLVRSLGKDFSLQSIDVISNTIMSHYLSCSQKRYKFARSFVEYLKEFIS